jgi:uncharacterized protein YndB with AHSA1/START domain
MKYICLGYLDEKSWEHLSEDERNALMDACLAYDDVLRKGGHFVGGEALQSARNATTLRYRNGKVSVTDGPYAETKEQLGGILILEATDLNHAVRLMSKHPGVKVGPFEIRPAEDLTSLVRDSERRRSAGEVGKPTTKPIDRLRVTRLIRAERGKVFQAFSDPRLAREWGPDGCRVVSFEADMRVGGTFRESMRCGGELHTAHGVYTAIIPGEKVVFTHQWEEEHPVETVVTVEFEDRKGGTEIILTQTGFRDASEAKGHAEGWSSALANFAKLLAGKKDD